MKIACVGDKITLLGFGLAGIKRQIIAEERVDAMEKIKKLVSTKEYAVVLITSGIYKEIEDSLKEIKSDTGLPIFLEIPETRLTSGLRSQ